MREKCNEFERQFVTAGKKYSFTVESTLTRNDEYVEKFVYRGRFRSEAPQACQRHKPYCLVLVQGQSTAASDDACTREYKDLYPYNGKYQKEILAYDDNTAKLLELYRTGDKGSFYKWLKGHEFMVIEPVYESCDPFFEKGSRGKTEREKLLFFYEILMALAELYTTTLWGKDQIDAHRDVKRQNILLNKGHVVLIDYASVHTIIKSGDTGVTRKKLMTSNNTPPELMVDGLQISEKTDVFAAGALLAELFGNTNPLMAWIGPVEHSQSEKILMEKYKNVLEKSYPDGSSWLEEETKGAFSFDAGTSSEICELFRSMITLRPEERPNLQSVAQKVESLLGLPVTGFLFLDEAVREQEQAAKSEMEAVCMSRENSASHFFFYENGNTAPDCAPISFLNVSAPPQAMTFYLRKLRERQEKRRSDPEQVLGRFPEFLASDIMIQRCDLCGRDVQIHVFSHTCPELTERAADFIQELERTCRSFQLVLHSDNERGRDQKWYHAFRPVKFLPVDDSQSKKMKNEPAQKSASENVPLNRTGYYMKIDGEKLYVTRGGAK